MRSMLSSTRRTMVACLATGVAVGGLLTATLPAGASGSVGKAAVGSAPLKKLTHYLSLGDSVPFGYREATNAPTPNYAKASNFMGFGEYVRDTYYLKLANAACPGETTASFLDAKKQSNGCETQPNGTPGYRKAFPLHVSYTTSQMKYAVSYLKANPDTTLVTLMLGANDGFLCQQATADHCTSPSELLGVLSAVSTNYKTILGKIRAVYKGQIVIVNYYSLNFSDATQTGQVTALNQAIDNAAKPYTVRIADGFGYFKKAAAQAGGNTCTAGLLTTLSGGGCGVHPSVAGQQVLASAVERVVRKG